MKPVLAVMILAVLCSCKHASSDSMNVVCPCVVNSISENSDGTYEIRVTGVQQDKYGGNLFYLNVSNPCKIGDTLTIKSIN